MSAAPKRNAPATAPKRGAPKAAVPDVLELEYSLAELPSAQHRAGLAGLVLMVQWLERQPGRHKGTCEIAGLSAGGATLRIDRDGLARLLDGTYAASLEESHQKAPWKKKGEEVPPVRIDEREVPDEKGKGKEKGKTKKEKVYVYLVTVPRGAFLEDFEPATRNGDKPWLKLWRNMLWETLRGVPATRAPFEARAEKEPTTDAADLWTDLTNPKTRSVDLPSTYYVGAQDSTAEGVSFKGRAREKLLLHFWPFAAQIYVPTVVKATEGKTEFQGYVIAVPDIADLETYCDILPGVLERRGTNMYAYRPREAVIDLPAEGALDMARRLRERITATEGEKATRLAVLGFELFHLSKEGNNVRLLSAARIEPEPKTLDEYILLKGMDLWDPTFRRVRLRNLLDNERRWYKGFDRVIATLPYDTMTIGSEAFRHDARVSFGIRTKESKDAMSNEEEDRQEAPLTLENVIYEMMQSYVAQKLKSKYDLVWRDITTDEEKKQYVDKKRKLAKEAFLAVRSRTDSDFVSYFAGTLCSVSQHLPRDRFALLTKALHDEREREHVRTLTLLALSAVS
ncbi:MAG: type I-MYXAN CRISPR-associated protein Cmx8 [Polyangiaceae bacterium]|nr:type I-MYXAN CRISPR-associated protein Cmx8 [Polyangiaceae bacterium]